MFYLILRLLHEEMVQDKITREEYFNAVVKIAHFHGVRRNGII